MLALCRIMVDEKAVYRAFVYLYEMREDKKMNNCYQLKINLVCCTSAFLFENNHLILAMFTVQEVVARVRGQDTSPENFFTKYWLLPSIEYGDMMILFDIIIVAHGFNRVFVIC